VARDDERDLVALAEQVDVPGLIRLKDQLRARYLERGAGDEA
jgi:hypothetical protein